MTFDNKKSEILERAIERYGCTAQIDVAIEEMSELIKALLKQRRADVIQDEDKLLKAEADIAEETADVYIMLAQLCMIFENGELVKSEIERKVARIAERLKK